VAYRLYQVLSISAIVLTGCGHKAPISAPSPAISPSTAVLVSTRQYFQNQFTLLARSLKLDTSEACGKIFLLAVR
jgi:hypothetical protein